MPLVRIDAIRADQKRLEGLGRAVHDALVQAIGIPEDDLFQVLNGGGAIRYDDGYLGIRRDDDFVVFGITMRSGRTPEQKQNLYRRIAELAHEYTGTEPRNVFVSITENEFVDWSFGEGVAQYLDAAPRT
ncbi:tautomerase family protein [Actinomadura rupiterrae]|uniref:tautomerase family protein n=1 Tax=Actinomadura rupiterrae TaxID=559627 RepID=UPI0020A370AC|nr:tautomerase family protein [Actinomadura rupiterrae]MCP2341233.1 phenylpyruvate tautomerase PptA (4-oxalocrotonate tautomerase family) [Actinomadura rupiterrae]